MNFNNIDLKGIKRFNKSLKQIRLNTQPSKENRFSVEIGGIAKEILTEAYTGTKFLVTDPIFNDKGFNIYAKGYGIAFYEFGTGAYAQNTYKGNLPKFPITFTTIVGVDSGGQYIKGSRTTQGWEYYYDNPITKDVVGGRLGWWTGSNAGFQEGFTASNKFYDACQKIKDEVKERSK